MSYNKCQQTRLDGGLCIDCGDHRGGNGTRVFCRSCASKHAQTATRNKQRRRAVWASSGEMVCNKCGAEKPDDNRKACTACRDKAALYNKTRGPQRRAEKSARSECWECASPKLPTANYCKRHFLRSILKNNDIPMNMADAMWQKLEDQEFCCFYSGRRLKPGINASIDHKTPRSRGGDNELPNLVWADRDINAFKNDSTAEEFFALCVQIATRWASGSNRNSGRNEELAQEATNVAA